MSSRRSSAVKVGFEELRLYGRDEELRVLMDAFDRAAAPPPEGSLSSSSTRVSIRGPSGCGKNSLVNEFLDKVSRKQSRMVTMPEEQRADDCTTRVVVGRGDFQEHPTSMLPFKPVTDAINAVVEQLIRWDRQGLNCGCWQRTFKDNFGVDPRIIQDVVPSIRQLIDDGYGDSDSDDERTLTSSMVKMVAKDMGDSAVQGGANEEVMTSNFQRLLGTLRSLLRAICGQTRPRLVVILVISHLEWADASSIKAVQYLTLDRKERSNLFFLTTSKRIDGASKELQRLMDLSVRRGLIEIELSDLPMSAISQVLANLLKRSLEDVKPLAVLVHHKTGGNAFFTLQYVKMLERKRLINYSLANYRWEWDTDSILRETDLSDNVAELVADKITSLPGKHQIVLMNASCLGSTRFDVNILFHSLVPIHNEQVKSGLDGDSALVETIEELEQCLLEASQHDVVEKISPREYKFSHTHIREATYSLLPEGAARNLAHLEIGRKARRLIKELTDEERGTETEDRLVLIAVNQLNLGSDLINDEAELIDLSQLNYQAARHARKHASFHSAVEYLENARRYLGRDLWKQNFTMQLSIDLARMYYCAGRQADSFALASELVNLAQTARDRRRASRTKIKCLIQQGKSNEALGIVLSELRALGIYFPSNFIEFHLLTMRRHARRLLKGKSDSDLLKVCMDVEEYKYSIMIFMSQLFDLLQRLSKPKSAELAELMQLVLTVEHDIGPGTSWVFAVWGAFLANQRNFSEACRFGKLALALNEREGLDVQVPSTVIMVHAYTQTWVKPYQESLDPLLRASEAIMRVGRVDEIKNGFFYASLYFCSGLRLRPLENDTRRLVESLVNHGLEDSRKSVAPLHQMVLNLIGDPDQIDSYESFRNPANLDGEALTKGEIEEWKSRGDMNTALQRSYLMRLILGYLFSDLKAAEEACKQLREHAIASASFWECERYFFEGLLYLSKAISNPRYYRKATRFVSLIEKWVRSGAVNCHHMFLIMRAEQAACCREGCRKLQSKEDRKKIQNKYDEAIAAAGRLGFLHHQALINERAGAFFQRQGDDAWAKIYLVRARELYFRWEAFALVKHIENKYDVYFKECSTLESHPAGDGFLRANSRLFDED